MSGSDGVSSTKHFVRLEEFLHFPALQHLVGTDGDAVTPPANLLNRHGMRRGRLANLDLDFRARRHAVSPAGLVEHSEAQGRGFVEGFGDHLDAVPDAGGADERDETEFRGHGDQNSTSFALSSPQLGEPRRQQI
jgi:hypothetical protein